MESTYEVRTEYNQDRKAYDYHIFEDGRFFITCNTLSQVRLMLRICKEEQKNA